jgi:hypothetical protein
MVIRAKVGWCGLLDLEVSLSLFRKKADGFARWTTQWRKASTTELNFGRSNRKHLNRGESDRSDSDRKHATGGRLTWPLWTDLRSICGGVARAAWRLRVSSGTLAWTWRRSGCTQHARTDRSSINRVRCLARQGPARWASSLESS